MPPTCPEGCSKRAVTKGVPVVDVHTHGTGLLPRPAWAVYRFVNRGHMPPDLGFDVLGPAGVDAVVAKAVGDPIVTRFHRGSPWAAVERQLEHIRSQATAAGAILATGADAVGAAQGQGHPAVVLGLEGADVLDGRVYRVDELFALGVRVVGLVHYVDNSLGTVCMPWQQWLPVRLPVRRRPTGLSPFGHDAMRRMQELGVLVDLAHADRATTLAACAAAAAPVISSHTGARALQDFDRFLGDEELRAVAGTGGLVGLWPFHYRDRGVADLADFARHASYLAELIGVDHLCIGTDMNGVSGLMDGYRGETDFPVLTDTLARAGFTADEVAAVAGGNFLRVWRACGG